MSTIYGSNNKKTFLELQKLNQGKINGNNAMLFLSFPEKNTTLIWV